MIELKMPCDKARISLQTSVQRDFILNGRKYLTGQLDLYSFRRQFGNQFDFSKPSSIIFEWEAKDALSSTIEISKNKDFSEIFIRGTGRNSFVAYNFELDSTYYWRVKNPREESEIFCFTTEQTAPRFLYFDGTTNVRDLGGYITESGEKVKQGLLIRGAELDMHAILSENGKRMMRDVLGIKTDIDLRGESIGFTMESPLGNDIKFIQVALWAYEDYLKEGNFSNIVKIFDVLADKNNYPVFFHCWGGADRTGCLAFTIEAILGLSEEILMQDFELTCLSFFGNIKSRTEKEFSAMVETLKEMGSTWKERMTNFLLGCGVSMEKIEKIREIMLEKA